MIKDILKGLWGALVFTAANATMFLVLVTIMAMMDKL